MIIIKLQGGLGNQLFQYQAYSLLCKRFDEVYLDVTEYNFPFNNGYRKFDLKSFETVPMHFIMFSNSYLERLIYNFFFKNIKVLSLQNKSVFNYINANEAAKLSSDLSEISDNTYIEGWFSNERFISDEEKRSFYFKPKIMNQNGLQSIYHKIKQTSSIAVHVRRTDYLIESEAYGNICTDLYYRNAIQYMEDRIDTPFFYFFSDDIEWCKKHFGIKDNYCYIDSSLVKCKNRTVSDLFLMSSCKNQIAANSTYSWWSAILNKETNKIILRPSRWTKNNDGSKIFPKEWIIING